MIRVAMTDGGAVLKARALAAAVLVALAVGCDQAGELIGPTSIGPELHSFLFDGDYGDDSSPHALDGESDDSRFVPTAGNGAFHHFWPSGEHDKRDATDTEALHRSGLIRPRQSLTDLGDDNGTPNRNGGGDWTAAQCLIPAEVWGGPIPNDTYAPVWQAIEACQGACSDVVNYGADSREAVDSCNGLLSPGYVDNARQLCLPCREVPR